MKIKVLSLDGIRLLKGFKPGEGEAKRVFAEDYEEIGWIRVRGRKGSSSLEYMMSRATFSMPGSLTSGSRLTLQSWYLARI